MAHPKGMKRDFAALEERRLRGARLLRRGMPPAEVARQTGASIQSVCDWARKMRAGGMAALHHPGRAGRKPRLSAAQLAAVAAGLKRGPEALGYESGLWTSARVADLIERECGVRYHPGHVWKILRRLGWSVQRPTGRALERDEAAIGRWRRVTWPALKKKRAPAAKPSSSSTRAD
jgi:transposase